MIGLYIFKGFIDKDFHAISYMKLHKNLNQCIHDAIDYDDNCGKEDKKEEKGSKANSSASSIAPQIEELTKGVAKKMQQLYSPPRAID